MSNLTCDVCGATCERLVAPAPGVPRVYFATDLFAPAYWDDRKARCFDCTQAEARKTIRVSDDG